MAYIGPKVSSILETDINWNNVKNVPASISKVFQSDGSTTEFDLGYEPANVESVRVSVNQMLKVPYTDYNIISKNKIINNISNEKISNVLIEKNIIECKDIEILQEMLKYSSDNKYEEIIISQDNLLLSENIDCFFNTRKLKKIQRKNDIIYIIKKNTFFDKEETIYGVYFKRNKINEYSNFLRLFYS